VFLLPSALSPSPQGTMWVFQLPPALSWVHLSSLSPLGTTTAKPTSSPLHHHMERREPVTVICSEAIAGRHNAMLILVVTQNRLLLESGGPVHCFSLFVILLFSINLGLFAEGIFLFHESLEFHEFHESWNIPRIVEYSTHRGKFHASWKIPRIVENSTIRGKFHASWNRSPAHPFFGDRSPAGIHDLKNKLAYHGMACVTWNCHVFCC
jgi:hypothetical protein